MALRSLQLKEKRAKIFKDMQALVEGAGDDGLDEDSTKKYEGYKAEMEKVSKQVELAEDFEKTEAQAVVDRSSVTAGAVRGAEAKTKFECLGEFFATVAYSPNDQRLDYKSELRVDIGSSGGFMVPPEFRAELLTAPVGDPAIVRPRAFVIPAGNNPDTAITIPALDYSSNNYGGVSFAFIGEGDTIVDTDAKIREINLTPNECAGTLPVTDKLLRNWPAANAMITQLFAGAIAAFEDQKFIRGTGVNSPLGILNSGCVKSVNRNTGSTVVYADFAALLNASMPQSNNLLWVLSPSIRSIVMTMTYTSLIDGAQRLVYDGGNQSKGVGATLLGIPVLWTSRASAKGSFGDVMLCDFSYYVIKDGFGPAVAVSEHILFRSAKALFRIINSVDGKPWPISTFTLDDGSTVVSPFVALN